MDPTNKLLFPLCKQVLISDNSNSFTNIDYSYQTEILINDHVGAFGTVRKNHTHEGVDLYCLPGDEVFAMEDGVVTLIEEFTGEFTNPPSPWWSNTRAVHIEGQAGVIVYGELLEDESIALGKTVKQGDLIGKVETVLRKDKGRPMTMLHLELYEHGARASVTWDVGVEKPILLKDPTPLLLSSMNAIRQVDIQCMNCGGFGWIPIMMLSQIADQEVCPECKGTKGQSVDLYFAKLSGEDYKL
jgi:hypothetical protein